MVRVGEVGVGLGGGTGVGLGGGTGVGGVQPLRAGHVWLAADSSHSLCYITGSPPSGPPPCRPAVMNSLWRRGGADPGEYRHKHAPPGSAH
jgi:hypothetical protein